MPLFKILKPGKLPPCKGWQLVFIVNAIKANIIYMNLIKRKRLKENKKLGVYSINYLNKVRLAPEICWQ